MKISVKNIDELLPQTQCGQCSYGGCRPYAEAIINQHELINRCPPGGTKVLRALGDLLHQDVTPFIAEMQEKQQVPAIAKIREAECIGCTKCIQACPVDAIIGSAKQMHTILTDECTGCGLCIDPCPVDCIDLIEITETTYNHDIARIRFNAKQLRVDKNKNPLLKQNELIQNDTTLGNNNSLIPIPENFPAPPTDQGKILADIAAAVERARLKKINIGK